MEELTTNLCNMADNIENITGMKNNSASPSDNWFIEFKDNIVFKSRKIKHGFLKLFINPNTIPKSSDNDTLIDTSRGLEYEINVYKDATQPLLDLKICPNFVTYIQNSLNCEYSELLDMLFDTLTNSRKLIRAETVMNNLNRNINYMVNNMAKTPAINLVEDSIDFYSSIESIELNTDLIVNDQPDRKYRYSLLLLENTKGEKLSKWLLNKRYTSTFETDLWNIIFQITAACYTMSLSKMTHNDLHAGNIFIQDLDVTTDFLYNINDVPILIRTKYKVLIFDFDRSYVKKLGENQILSSEICSETSQCNEFIENKDIVKIFCYITNFLQTNDLIDLLSPNPFIQDILNHVYNFKNKKGIKKCFLQYKENTSVPSSFYDSINSTLYILMEIYENFLHKYDADDMLSVNENNLYYCNHKMFDENGNIIKTIKSDLDGKKTKIFKKRHLKKK